MPTEPQSQPLVSIIVPVYNAADHIARCIESIRRQTYRNLEIILLNDGSKDVSYAVCQSYAGIDRRIVVIDKNNSGVSATRNLGMQEAHGKYFQFVDADDFKSVNDTYGHEFGDQVLIRIAQVLEEECPQQGYVCRYGGDEFIGFFPYATSEKAQQYTDHVQSRLTKENIMISIGVELTFAGGEETIDEYLSLADQNMYRQKQMRKESRKNID